MSESPHIAAHVNTATSGGGILASSDFTFAPRHPQCQSPLQQSSADRTLANNPFSAAR